MNELDDEQESELIYINPHKDVLHYQVPLTHDKEGQTEKFKQMAAESLAKKIIEMIEPDYIEMNGFELMHYSLVVKKYVE